MTIYISQKIKIVSLLAMCMVVFIHAYNHSVRYLEPSTMVTDGISANRYVQLLISNGMARWAIPMFFLISGYLNYPVQPRPYAVLVRKRLLSLLVPYLLWSMLGLLLYRAVQHNEFLWQVTLKADLGPFSDTRIADYTAGQLLLRWLLLPLPFQLWFIRCLLVYCLLSPLLLKALARNAPVILGIFGILWLTGFWLHFIEGEGLLFFSLGLWLHQRQINLENPPAWFRLEWFAAGWLMLLLLKTALAFGPYDVVRPALELIMYRVSQIPGVLVVWFGYDRLRRGRLPSATWLRLSAFSFIIYGMHAPLLHIVSNGLLLHFGESEPVLWWVYIGSSLAVIGACTLAGIALKALVPSVFGILTGGRGLG